MSGNACAVARHRPPSAVSTQRAGLAAGSRSSTSRAAPRMRWPLASERGGIGRRAVEMQCGDLLGRVTGRPRVPRRGSCARAEQPGCLAAGFRACEIAEAEAAGSRCHSRSRRSQSRASTRPTSGSHLFGARSTGCKVGREVGMRDRGKNRNALSRTHSMRTRCVVNSGECSASTNAVSASLPEHGLTVHPARSSRRPIGAPRGLDGGIGSRKRSMSRESTRDRRRAR